MIGSYLNLKYEIGFNSKDVTEINQMKKYEDAIPEIIFTHPQNPHLKTSSEILKNSKNGLKNYSIFIVRDPRDVIVSMYFEKTKRAGLYGEPKYNGTLKDFIYEEKGSLKSLITFYNHKLSKFNAKKTLIVKYENLHNHPFITLKSVLSFLKVPIDEQLVYKAVECSTFENMKQIESQNQTGYRLRPYDHTDIESYKVRKGKIGGYKEYLDNGEINFLNKYIDENLTKKLDY
jgi:hypothetical protein